MPSFRISLSPSRRAAGRYVADVRQRLQQALAENPDISQSRIAAEIGVHRAVISRQLHGRQDIGLSRVAEIAALLGYRPKFDLVRISPSEGSNIAVDPLKPAEPPQPNFKIGFGNASAVVRKEYQRQVVDG